MSEEVLCCPSPQPHQPAPLSEGDGAEREGEKAGSRAEEELLTLHTKTIQLRGQRKGEKGEADSYIKPSLTGSEKQDSYCKNT